jgi:hypothetical protein
LSTYKKKKSKRQKHNKTHIHNPHDVVLILLVKLTSRGEPMQVMQTA